MPHSLPCLARSAKHLPRNNHGRFRCPYKTTVAEAAWRGFPFFSLLVAVACSFSRTRKDGFRKRKKRPRETNISWQDLSHSRNWRTTAIPCYGDCRDDRRCFLLTMWHKAQTHALPRRCKAAIRRHRRWHHRSKGRHRSHHRRDRKIPAKNQRGKIRWNASSILLTVSPDRFSRGIKRDKVRATLLAIG